ncbi:MAG: hypothetical protein ABIK73_07065 [candidate division WOR-3 bacterium]
MNDNVIDLLKKFSGQYHPYEINLPGRDSVTVHLRSLKHSEFLNLQKYAKDPEKHLSKLYEICKTCCKEINESDVSLDDLDAAFVEAILQMVLSLSTFKPKDAEENPLS